MQDTDKYHMTILVHTMYKYHMGPMVHNNDKYHMAAISKAWAGTF